jgi:hypothetical protein
VYRGSKSATAYGKSKEDLAFSKHGRRVVSKRKSEAAKVTIAKPDNAFSLWRQAREAIRAELNFSMVLCGDKTARGQAFLEATRARFEQLKQNTQV